MKTIKKYLTFFGDEIKEDDFCPKGRYYIQFFENDLLLKEEYYKDKILLVVKYYNCNKNYTLNYLEEIHFSEYGNIRSMYFMQKETLDNGHKIRVYIFNKRKLCEAIDMYYDKQGESTRDITLDVKNNFLPVFQTHIEIIDDAEFLVESFMDGTVISRHEFNS